jgi:glycosyltransferase involved in cell wall biosynthesis
MTEVTEARLVSVVVPLYNETETLAELMRRLQAVCATLELRYRFEFVFVDDGSRDTTVEEVEAHAATDTRVRVVVLRRNYGQTAALQVGFEHARGEIVVSMDGDLQHFPEDIPALLARIDEGYDVVCGWRANRKEGIVRRWPSRVANWTIRRLTRIAIHDVGTTFRAYRADVVRELRMLGENHRFIPVIAASLGARITEIPIQNIVRPSGTSNYGLSRTFNVLLDIGFFVFYVRYLDRPMRLFGRAAFALFAAATLISLMLAYLYFADGVPVVREHSGWFILALILYIGGLQFLLFGLLSEVLARQYFYPAQTKPYLVRRVVGEPDGGER